MTEPVAPSVPMDTATCRVTALRLLSQPTNKDLGECGSSGTNACMRLVKGHQVRYKLVVPGNL
ncbi:conserved hypothetical protein [Coccidioides posadasii str. Silveira]|uniref:Uncharacterized protein n=2 Tax=Coccidioides posadasii TaxID=199306 RepID=E9DC73_COCPS|nr:conserved hypothetical protein [Coccidioides posadasii str. Silveira]KMM69109.1 hypothetical protein CPAG_05431 [Coccidioides posadasii RMSCC 3488]